MQNVLITGTGRPQALGFNLAKRYLEHGDRVYACVRKSTDAFAELLSVYPEALTVLVMDIMDTPSVRAASEAVAAHVDRLDTIINNAVTTAPDYNASVMEANPDNISDSVNVGAAGPLRVIQTFCPLLKKSDMVLSSTFPPKRAASAHAKAEGKTNDSTIPFRRRQRSHYGLQPI